MTALRKLPWDLLIVLALAGLPFVPGLFDSVDRFLRLPFGSEMTTLFIMAVLALGLHVVVGYTGVLQLGVAAFFGIGAYVTGILTVPSLPFHMSFPVSLVAATLFAAFVGLLLAAPTLRLRGDYLALVTLGFGEVTKFALKNMEAITNGTKGLNPIPAPKMPEFTGATGDWGTDFRYFYFLTLGVLFVVLLVLRNLEKSRLGRAWIALREDELAATCMGLNTGRLKLAAFGLGAGIAGLAGCLYATKLGNTADPNAYGFNRSVTILCCLILGGLGNRTGVLLGVFLIVGFDNILAPAMDKRMQAARGPGAEVIDYETLSFWKLMAFGLALVLVMRFRPEGLLPSSRVKRELHPDETLPESAADPVTGA
jgi:branched-chain amino acid transport system permease protein